VRAWGGSWLGVTGTCSVTCKRVLVWMDGYVAREAGTEMGVRSLRELELVGGVVIQVRRRITFLRRRSSEGVGVAGG